MKKLLLASLVLTTGLSLTQAGINISIGLPLPPLPPLPRPAVVIHQPVVACPPPVVVTPLPPPPCGPRVVITTPPPVYHYYQPYPGHVHYRPNHPGPGPHYGRGPHSRW